MVWHIPDSPRTWAQTCCTSFHVLVTHSSRTRQNRIQLPKFAYCGHMTLSWEQMSSTGTGLGQGSASGPVTWGMPRATSALFPAQAPSWQPTAPKQHRHNKVGLQPRFQVERTDRCSHQALTSGVHLLRYANPALGVSREQQRFQRAQGPLSLQQLRTMTQLPNLGRQLSRKLRRTRLFHHLSFPYKKALWATT